MEMAEHYKYFPTLTLRIKSSRDNLEESHLEIRSLVAKNTASISLHFSSLQTALQHNEFIRKL